MRIDCPIPLSNVSESGSRVPPVDPHASTTTDLILRHAELTGSTPRDEAEIGRLRNEIVVRHMVLIRETAARLLRLLPKSIRLEDLVSDGTIGLMRAIRGFDPARGVQFKTYAQARIRGAMLDQLRSSDWVPRLVRSRATRIERSIIRLAGEHGRTPTHSELAHDLDVSAAELPEYLDSGRARRVIPLVIASSDDSAALQEGAHEVDSRMQTPDEALAAAESMNDLLRDCSTKERFIMSRYYQEDLTFKEIGAQLGLTESRICQIHTNLVARLRLSLPKPRGAPAVAALSRSLPELAENT